MVVCWRNPAYTGCMDTQTIISICMMLLPFSMIWVALLVFKEY